MPYGGYGYGSYHPPSASQSSGSSYGQHGTYIVPGMGNVYSQLLGLNEQNYGNILGAYSGGESGLNSKLPGIYGGYGDVLSGVENTLGLGGALGGNNWGVATPAAQAIASSFEQTQGKNTQDAISQGLGGFNLLPELQNQAALQAGQAFGGLGAQLAQTAAGYQGNIGLAGLGAQMQGLGMQSGLNTAAMGDLAGYHFANTAGNLTGPFGYNQSVNTSASGGGGGISGPIFGQPGGQTGGGGGQPVGGIGGGYQPQPGIGPGTISYSQPSVPFNQGGGINNPSAGTASGGSSSGGPMLGGGGINNPGGTSSGGGFPPDYPGGTGTPYGPWGGGQSSGNPNAPAGGYSGYGEDFGPEPIPPKPGMAAQEESAMQGMQPGGGINTPGSGAMMGGQTPVSNVPGSGNPYAGYYGPNVGGSRSSGGMRPPGVAGMGHPAIGAASRPGQPYGGFNPSMGSRPGGQPAMRGNPYGSYQSYMGMVNQGNYGGNPFGAGAAGAYGANNGSMYAPRPAANYDPNQGAGNQGVAWNGTAGGDFGGMTQAQVNALHPYGSGINPNTGHPWY